MDFWEKVRNDFQKGITENLATLKDASVEIKKKASSLVVEGKRQLDRYEIKRSINRVYSELGERIYDLVTDKESEPLADSQVQDSIGFITELKSRLSELEQQTSDTEVIDVKPAKKVVPKHIRTATPEKKVVLKKKKLATGMRRGQTLQEKKESDQSQPVPEETPGSSSQ